MNDLRDYYGWLSERRLQNPTPYRFLTYELQAGSGDDSGLVSWRSYWALADLHLSVARVTGWGYVRGDFLVLNRWQLIEDEDDIPRQQIAEHLDQLAVWDQTRYVIKFYDLGQPVVWSVDAKSPITKPDEVASLRKACREARPPRGLSTLPRSPHIGARTAIVFAKVDSRKTSALARFVYVEASPYYEALLAE